MSETSLPKALDPPPAIVTAAEPVQPPTTTDVPADAGSGTDVPSSVTVTVTTMDGPDAADAPPPSVPRDTAAQSPAEQEGEGQNPATLAGTGPERLLIQRPESSRSNPRLSRLNILRRRRPKSMRQPRRRCGLSGSRLGRLIGCRGKYQTQVQTPEAPDSEALEDASDAAAGGDHAALSLDDRTAPMIAVENLPVDAANLDMAPARAERFAPEKEPETSHPTPESRIKHLGHWQTAVQVPADTESIPLEAEDAKSSISVSAPSEPLADKNLHFIAEKDANSNYMTGHITESDSENHSQNQTQ